MFRYKDYIYEVYKEKSISKAAASLYISQPSLSAKIIKTEAALGMPIFDRSTSPIRLTEFGKVYIKAIEDIKDIEKGIESFIDDSNMLRTGTLSVGASNVFAAYTLPPIIAAFKERYPELKINLIEGNTEMLEELLSTNRVDIVMDNNHYDLSLYDRALYSEERILLAVPTSFPECAAAAPYAIDGEAIRTKAYRNEDFPAVPLSLFAKTPFIMLTSGNDTRIRADKMCREAGVRPRIALEVHQQATAYMIATTNMGATFVSDTVIEKMPAGDTMAYYKIDSTAAERLVYFYFKRHKHKTRAAEEFMKFLT